jgi:hypothetical protein
MVEEAALMESLQAFFTENGRDIHSLARYIQRHVDEHWEAIYNDTRPEMVDKFPQIGDTVYGIYGSHLFKPVHDQLKQVGLRATPRLPGHFMSSREWGPEDERQRWMWSKITLDNGAAVGTIAVAFYHDHNEIRIPRAFKIVALDETAKGAVIAALSRLYPDFETAQDAKTEIAAYLAQMASQDS